MKQIAIRDEVRTDVESVVWGQAVNVNVLSLACTKLKEPVQRAVPDNTSVFMAVMYWRNHEVNGWWE